MHKTQRNIFRSWSCKSSRNNFLFFLSHIRNTCLNLVQKYVKLIYYFIIFHHYININIHDIYTSCIIRLKRRKTKKKITITCKILLKNNRVYLWPRNLYISMTQKNWKFYTLLTTLADEMSDFLYGMWKFIFAMTNVWPF